MHVDLDCVDSEACSPKTFWSRVCIAGGGVAGIILASSLASKGIKVQLLEGGGLEPEEKSQQLYNVKMAGAPHCGAIEGRFRTFGGSSTRWGGQMLPYTEDVFDPPQELGLPRWPLELREIEPYYGAVQRIFQVSQRPFTDALLASFHLALPLNSEEVRLRFSKWAPFTRRNLAHTLGKECVVSKQTTLYTHANVISVELNESGGSVRELTVMNNCGTRFRFTADIFVLCLGTIETSRLLLASRSLSGAGVGNEHDQVGRYFHDHVGVTAAEIEPSCRAELIKRFAPFVSGRTLHTPKLEATPKLRQEQGLLSVMAHFPIEEPDNSGIGSLRSILTSMQRKQFDRSFCSNLLDLPRGSAEILNLAWAAKVKGRRAVSKRARISLHIDCEQKPRSESRIKISEECDRLGMPIGVVVWKVGEEEHETVRKFAAIIEESLRNIGIKGSMWRPELNQNGNGWLACATDTYHMMGGTRMGTDPASSVVDGNLRVHGIENLYIASCSTFPTGGSSNPTFTLMAMVLRLKDRIAAL